MLMKFILLMVACGNSNTYAVVDWLLHERTGIVQTRLWCCFMQSVSHN